jgi:hypothetical protein
MAAAVAAYCYQAVLLLWVLMLCSLQPPVYTLVIMPWPRCLHTSSILAPGHCTAVLLLLLAQGTSTCALVMVCDICIYTSTLLLFPVPSHRSSCFANPAAAGVLLLLLLLLAGSPAPASP